MRVVVVEEKQAVVVYGDVAHGCIILPAPALLVQDRQARKKIGRMRYCY